MEKTKVYVENVDVKDYIAYLDVTFEDAQFGDKVMKKKGVAIGKWDSKLKTYVEDPDKEESKREFIREYYGEEFEALEQLIGQEIEFFITDDYQLCTTEPTNSLPDSFEEGDEYEGTIDEVLFTPTGLKIIFSVDEHKRLLSNVRFTKEGNIDPSKRKKQLDKFFNKTVKVDDVNSIEDLDKLAGKDVRVEIQEFEEGKLFVEVKKIA